MSVPRSRGFRFGSFSLLPDERRLFAGDRPVRLTPKAFDTLVVLVENRHRLLSKDELLRTLWPDSFVEDVTLARNISDLRKALAEDGGDLTYIETVPKHGYRFVADVVDASDQPAAAVPTTGSPAPPATVAARDPLPPVWRTWTATRVAVTMATAGLVTLCLVAAWAMRPPASASERPVRSVAILPFQIAAGDGLEYLGLGLADALITRLHRIPGLSVRPASAIARFDRTKQDAAAYGRALRVDAVLDGSVRRFDSRLRVSLQLVRVEDGTTLWAEQHDAPLADPFALEDAIAAKVGGAIASTTGGGPPPAGAETYTATPEALHAYLSGRYVWNKRRPGDLTRAAEWFEEAVRLDPSYALAHAGLADAYLLLGGYSVKTPDAMVPRAKAAALRALELDASLAEAQTTLGLIAMNYDWDWHEAERRYQRAIELNPNYAVAHAWYGEYLAFMGRFDEGLDENARAQELDPLSVSISADGGKILYLARRYDAAIGQLRKTLEMDPSYPMARIILAVAYAGKGSHEEAMTVLETPGPSDDDQAILMALGVVYADAGKTRQAHAILDRLTSLAAASYVSPAYLAYLQMRLGMIDEAFRSLDRMLDERAAGVIGLKWDPVYEPVRRDPRFPALLRRAGFGS